MHWHSAPSPQPNDGRHPPETNAAEARHASQPLSPIGDYAMGRSLEQSRSHHYRPQPPQKHFTGANGTINRLRRKVPSLQNGVRHFQAAWEIILRECRGIARADDLAAPAVAAGSNAALPRSAGFAVWRSFSAVAHPASHAACRFSATALPWQLIIGLSSGRDTTAMARSLTARRRRCQTLRGGRYCA